MKTLYTIGLLILSNTFMTLAWYGHLKYSEWKGLSKLGMGSIIMVSWGIAFFEYCLMIPANRIGYYKYGGPFTLVQLKVMQAVITLVIFSLFTLFLFKSESLRWNHLAAFVLLITAVYLVFKK